MAARLSNINGRFKDAPWGTLKPSILIGGIGGIGSNTTYCLSKSIIGGKIFIIDQDTVDEHNVGKLNIFRIFV